MGRINQDLQDLIDHWRTYAEEYRAEVGYDGGKVSGIQKCAKELEEYLPEAEYELEVLDNAVSSADRSTQSWKAAMSGMLDELQETIGVHRKHLPSYTHDSFMDLIDGWNKIIEDYR